MKNILILGKGGYIAEQLHSWLSRYPEKYDVEIASTLNSEWKQADFSKAEVVVNCAGIAHINNITEDMKPLFYAVNCNLAIEMAKHAKSCGVNYFIQFSSMNVYGDCCECVTDRNAEAPTSFYGDSKLQGDKGLEELKDETFIVAHLRPPFVYGKGCKGNYNTISSIAQKTPIFPTYKNRKSMIYIDNLCEFVRLCVDEKVSGILTPQNKELVSTADLVREICAVHGKRIWFTKLFNWVIPFGVRVVNSARKAFTDDCYDINLSDYFGWEYCVVDFKNSIKTTEKTI